MAPCAHWVQVPPLGGHSPAGIKFVQINRRCSFLLAGSPGQVQSWQASRGWISVPFAPRWSLLCSEKPIQPYMAALFASSPRVRQDSCTDLTFLYSVLPATYSGLWERGWAPGPPRASLFGKRGFCCLWVPLGAQTLKGSSLSNLGAPPGRGSCPLATPLPFDLVYTDYHGLQHMKRYMGLSFRKYR